jgi:hypothetical protein
MRKACRKRYHELVSSKPQYNQLFTPLFTYPTAHVTTSLLSDRWVYRRSHLRCETARHLFATFDVLRVHLPYLEWTETVRKLEASMATNKLRVKESENIRKYRHCHIFRALPEVGAIFSGWRLKSCSSGTFLFVPETTS